METTLPEALNRSADTAPIPKPCPENKSESLRHVNRPLPYTGKVGNTNAGTTLVKMVIHDQLTALLSFILLLVVGNAFIGGAHADAPDESILTARWPA